MLLTKLNKEAVFFSMIYNCRAYCLHNDEDIQEVAIIHWDDEKKPWTFAVREMKCPERQWKKEFLELANEHLKLIRALPPEYPDFWKSIVPYNRLLLAPGTVEVFP